MYCILCIYVTPYRDTYRQILGFAAYLFQTTCSLFFLTEAEIFFYYHWFEVHMLTVLHQVFLGHSPQLGVI